MRGECPDDAAVGRCKAGGVDTKGWGLVRTWKRRLIFRASSRPVASATHGFSVRAGGRWFR